MSDESLRLHLCQSDRPLIERLKASVRHSLTRPSLAPKDVVSLGYLLHGLSILPRVDPAVSVSLSVYPDPVSTNLDLNLSIGADELVLAAIERHDAPHGGDTLCHLVVSFNVYEERRFGDLWSVRYWLRQWEEALESSTSRLEIIDESDSGGINWELVSNPDEFLTDEPEHE